MAWLCPCFQDRDASASDGQRAAAELVALLRMRSTPVFNDLEGAGIQLESPHILVAALAGKAAAVRYQDRLDDAERLIRSAIARAEQAAMSKAVADGYYTLALVQEERQQIVGALESMLSAKKQYAEIGDTASEGDASRQLARMTLKK